MNERIKKIRKSLGLSQTEFGARIRVKQTSIAGYETGIRVPRDSTISLICREFHVNEEWLRTGQGEMFIKKSRDEEISEFLDDTLSGDPDFRQRFISVLARMSPDEWKLLEKMILKVATEFENSSQELPKEKLEEAEPDWEAEADAFAAMAREQFLSERKRESSACFARESDAG